MRSTASTTKMH